MLCAHPILLRKPLYCRFVSRYNPPDPPSLVLYEAEPGLKLAAKTPRQSFASPRESERGRRTSATFSNQVDHSQETRNFFSLA